MTIIDVAKEAGVAVRTASKAINNDPTVRDYLKKRVLKAADKLDYTPNLVARSLKNTSSNLVSLTVIDLYNPYFGHLAEALTDRLQNFGYEAVLSSHIDQVLNLYHSYSSCGSILSSGAPFEKIADLAKKHKITTLNSGDYDIDNVSDVSIDFKSAYTELAEKLIELGRKKPVFLSDRFAHEIKNVKKFRHSEKVFLDSGHKPLCSCSNNETVSEKKFRHLLDEKPDLDLVICENDITAALVYMEMSRRGIKVPDDILIVGCDGSLKIPGSWTVKFDIEKSASEAVRVFRKLLDSNKSEKVLLDYKILKSDYI